MIGNALTFSFLKDDGGTIDKIQMMSFVQKRKQTLNGIMDEDRIFQVINFFNYVYKVR